MGSRLLALLPCLLLCLAVGCEPEAANPPAPTGRVLPGRVGAPDQAGAAAGGGLAAPGADVPAPGGAPAQLELAGAAAPFPIRLSAGTALPQTGPEGTLMSFSVDYQATGYEPQTSVRCVLVIERGDRQRVEQQLAEVSASGTWAAFVQGWPPEAGPFQAWVEEISGTGSRRRLSAVVPLR
jgi:hypothetical protein